MYFLHRLVRNVKIVDRKTIDYESLLYVSHKFIQAIIIRNQPET